MQYKRFKRFVGMKGLLVDKGCDNEIDDADSRNIPSPMVAYKALIKTLTPSERYIEEGGWVPVWELRLKFDVMKFGASGWCSVMFAEEDRVALFETPKAALLFLAVAIKHSCMVMDLRVKHLKKHMAKDPPSPNLLLYFI